MDPRVAGLRAQDVYSGLQTVDQTSGLIAAELGSTRITGMAATVATNIKGIDLIKDPKALKVVAAQQWGIDSFALPSVLEVLQEVDYVTLHKDKRGKLSHIDEHIPLLHEDLYERLGAHWEDSSPSELDRASVDSLERLAAAPMRFADFEATIEDADTTERLLQIGNVAQFTRVLELPDGDRLVWSPFCAYEQPEALSELFGSFDGDEIREQFGRVREYQGLPLDGEAGVLAQAVGQGVLLANTIEGSGGSAAFAFVPYNADPAQLRMKKAILEKAIVLLACVRYGQHYARHRIRMPELLLHKLQDGGSLNATTEASSQYRTAAQEQILRLEDDGDGFYRARLIETPDNVAAVNLAIDLLTHGEPLASREDPEQKLLFTGRRYLTPLMTMKDQAPRQRLDGEFVASLLDTFRGERGG